MDGVLDCVGVTVGILELVTTPDTVHNALELDEDEGEGARESVDLTDTELAGL